MTAGRPLIVEVHLDAADLDRALRDDVHAGLTADEPWLPPKWFYDARGSRLFDEITRLPEYYPTRRETEILERRAAEIVARARPDTLVELGSGFSTKTRLLLDACRSEGSLRCFAPVDVDEATLRSACESICDEYAGLAVHAVVGDFERHLEQLPDGGRRMVAFLGSTIGNLEPAERARFLRELAGVLDPGDTLLLGTDLVKDVGRLVAAYDDAVGVTAEFNRNVLHVVNNRLGADFEPDRFAHVALWDADNEWIEMRLRAGDDQVVLIRELDLKVELPYGTEIRTEISAKFRRAGVERELRAAGFVLDSWWTDRVGDFALSLSVRQMPS